MSPKREHSASSMEMETDSAEEEDGQSSKLEEEEEKERKLLNRAHPDEDRVTLQDLEKVRLSRDMLAKHYLSPWFEEYVKGETYPTIEIPTSNLICRCMGTVPHWC